MVKGDDVGVFECLATSGRAGDISVQGLGKPGGLKCPGAVINNFGTFKPTAA